MRTQLQQLEHKVAQAAERCSAAEARASALSSEKEQVPPHATLVSHDALASSRLVATCGVPVLCQCASRLSIVLRHLVGLITSQPEGIAV